MKNVYILGGILLVVAVVGFWYQSAMPLKTGNDSAVTTVTERAILTPLSSDVSMTSLLDPEAWKVVSDASEVEDGAGVRTSSEGRAVIANDEEIITSLNNSSEIKLSLSAGKKQTQVELIAGETWTKIERALEQDEVYEVYTPTMVAAVRGTSFGVSLNSKKSLVVAEGTVEATQIDPATGLIKPGTSVLVTAGNTLEDNGEEFVVRSSTDADKDEWYVTNNPEAESRESDTETAGEAMIQTDPPAESFPPGQSGGPPTESEVSTSTETESEPEPKSAPITLSVSDISPDRFTYGEEDRIAFYGNALDQVTRVEFNDDRVDFIVTSQGVLGVATDELPDRDRVYDVKLVTADNELLLKNAVEVFESEPVIVLEIEEVMQGGNPQLEEVFLIVRGPGMDIVETVLINNEPMEFELFSSTELHVFDVYAETGMTVTVRGEGLTDQVVL